MAYPIIEQIAQAIETRLKTIKPPAYNVTIAEVTRPTREGGDWHPANLVVRLVQDDAQRVDDSASPLGYAVWMQLFAAVAFVVPSDTAAAAVDQTVNYVRADIEKCIMTDPSWGGLALDTRALAAEFLPSDGSYCGIVVSAEVHYRTKIGDPYSQ